MDVPVVRSEWEKLHGNFFTLSLIFKTMDKSNFAKLKDECLRLCQLLGPACESFDRSITQNFDALSDRVVGFKSMGAENLSGVLLCIILIVDEFKTQLLIARTESDVKFFLATVKTKGPGLEKGVGDLNALFTSSITTTSLSLSGIPGSVDQGRSAMTDLLLAMEKAVRHLEIREQGRNH
jgi:hypothetical protein